MNLWPSDARDVVDFGYGMQKLIGGMNCFINVSSKSHPGYTAEVSAFRK